MTLFTELQERWKAIFLERESVEKRADELAEDMQELEVALVALQGLHAPIADEQPELFDEPQEIEASSQSESCVPELGAETDLQTSPGEAEESRDQFEEEAERAAAIELTADVMPESGLHDDWCPEYASAERPALNEQMQDERELTAALPQPEWNEPRQSISIIDEQTCEPVDPTLRAFEDDHIVEPQPTEGYAPVTNPEADALARAHDWYDPKAVHDRNRFNPWGGVAHLFGKPKVDA